MKSKKGFMPIAIISFFLILAIIVILMIIMAKEEPLSSAYGVSVTPEGSTVRDLNRKSFLSVVTSDCTPMSGYDICQRWQNTNGQATATVQVQMSEGLRGTKKGGYYVGDVTLPVRLSGDNFYLYEAKNVKTWNDFWFKADCDQNGCRNFERKLSSQENIILARAGEQYRGCPVVVGHDYSYVEQNRADGLYWWWSYVYGGRGYIDVDNKGFCWDIKSVSCYDDTDCHSAQFCDKSGAWDTWSCQIKPVETECFACESDKLIMEKIPRAQCSTYNNVLYTEDEASCKVAKPSLFVLAEEPKNMNILQVFWKWIFSFFGGEK